MPLVVPGMQNTSGKPGGSESEQWALKLMGKKLGDKHDDVTFAKKDLPADHRVIGKDSMSTMDFKPERLNVHLNDDGTVAKVNHG